MLTDVAIKALKPKNKTYKVGGSGWHVRRRLTCRDCDVSYDYRVNGRRETLTIGRYRRGGVGLAAAREKCMDARRLVEPGVSPAKEKKRSKMHLSEAGSFSDMANRWIDSDDMAESTRDMRRHILNRDILPAFGRCAGVHGRRR